MNLNLIYETLWIGAGSGLMISMLEKLNWFHVIGLKTFVLLMWKWMDLLSRKNHLLWCWGWLSLSNWVGALILSLLCSNIISIAKTASKKIWALICSVKFLSREAALYLYKSNIFRCYRDVYVNSFFLHSARLWNSLPIELMISFDLLSKWL